MSDIAERLAELERLGLSRRLRMISGPQGPTVLLDGKPVLLLCSNNYLGLADHPRVREAAADAAMRWGVGAGSSRLVSGSMTIHRRLEERLAGFEGTESCVLFGSGYLANIGVIGALAGADDVIFSDELNHASIVDGCRLSRAEVVIYRHRDIEHLDWSLRRHGERRARRLIVTDSVFSMDGDIAPLAHIAELAQIYGARIVVDEAHATGNVGPDGRGAVAAAGLEGEIDVVIGTLGKALGSYGAYACASTEMVQYLINTARSLIFSTAPGPPAAAGALAALELLQERPHRVGRLRSNARALRRGLAGEGFGVADSEMHIVPLIVGEERAAMALCQQALELGVFAQAIRPPTVPAGTSRLRLTVMASHTPGELREAARTLCEAARRVGIDPEQVMAPAAEPLDEVQEIETALGRAERLAASTAAEDDEASGTPTPFDFERDAPGAAPAVAPSLGEELAALSERIEEPGAATELFDVEREATVRAA
ncbi:MAG: 8-amino-7-oxononanoate synthase [Solirubrobacteraceae bacterium]|jgi:glycine C-acetyltransferase/8-amino-7-oxononanoate synthase|nr:8-amino-7-oxononanoate synthase [Solirubrobacterales bacterium]MEA2214570.1 8-amino-7-oxononanoate synthase [Solirubrobacteraceae bacterium]